MQAVFAESEPTSVRAAYHAAIDAIAGFSGEAAELLEEAEADALEREAPPEPAIDAETRLRAERLVLVAMESAGVAPRAA